MALSSRLSGAIATHLLLILHHVAVSLAELLGQFPELLLMDLILLTHRLEAIVTRFYFLLRPHMC